MLRALKRLEYAFLCSATVALAIGTAGVVQYAWADVKCTDGYVCPGSCSCTPQPDGSEVCHEPSSCTIVNGSHSCNFDTCSGGGGGGGGELEG